jgi:hypothetical protein
MRFLGIYSVNVGGPRFTASVFASALAFLVGSTTCYETSSLGDHMFLHHRGLLIIPSFHTN